ncbi:MAG TPA: ferrous iron transport protein A [Coriobacteriia bacterium]
MMKPAEQIETAVAEVQQAICATCTLADARAGQHFVVTGVGDAGARVTALRFGMAEGACVHCTARIPAGPIVLRSGRQEIAVGRELAKLIDVRRVIEGT